MKESDLIYDWNVVNYDFSRDESNHPHPIWFDDETLRDGLQSPSARNPTIEEKIELLTYMEKLGIRPSYEVWETRPIVINISGKPMNDVCELD